MFDLVHRKLTVLYVSYARAWWPDDIHSCRGRDKRCL